MVRRHEVLRTCFINRDGTPVQVIAPLQGDASSWQALDIPVEDLSALPEGEREARALALVTAEAQQPFDLSRAPLLRARLLRLGAQDHVALFTLHHIVSDGWSMNVFTREMAALYAARVQGAPAPLAPLPVQYADYAQWQRAWLQGEVLDRQRAYWQQQLAHAPDLLDLPTDHPRPAVQTFRGRPSPATSARRGPRAQGLGPRGGVTLFMTLLAAFQALLLPLQRPGGHRRRHARSPTARAARSEGLIGFFVNTLVLRTDLSGEPPSATCCGACARRAGRLRPPGPALRDAGRGAAARAQTLSHTRCSR